MCYAYSCQISVATIETLRLHIVLFKKKALSLYIQQHLAMFPLHERRAANANAYLDTLQQSHIFTYHLSVTFFSLIVISVCNIDIEYNTLL